MSGIHGAHVKPFLASVDAARGHVERAADQLDAVAAAHARSPAAADDVFDDAAMHIGFFRGELRDARTNITTRAASDAVRTLMTTRVSELDESLALLRVRIAAAGHSTDEQAIEAVSRLQAQMRDVTGRMLDDVARKATAPGAGEDATLGAVHNGGWASIEGRIDREISHASKAVRDDIDSVLDDAEATVRATPPDTPNHFRLDDGTHVITGNMFDAADHEVADPAAHFAAQLAEYDDSMVDVLAQQTPHLKGPDAIRAQAADAWASTQPKGRLRNAPGHLPMTGSASPMDEQISAGERLFTTISDADGRNPGGERVRHAKHASFPVPDLHEFVKMTADDPRTRWAVAPRESGGWNVVELAKPTETYADGHLVPATSVSGVMRAVRAEGRAFDGIVNDGVLLRFSDHPGTKRSTRQYAATDAGQAILDMQESLARKFPGLKPAAATDEELLASVEKRYIADWLTVPQPGEHAGRLSMMDVRNADGPGFDLPLTYAPGDVTVVTATSKKEAASQLPGEGMFSVHHIAADSWGIVPLTSPGMGRKMNSDLALQLLVGTVDKADNVDGVYVNWSFFLRELTG